MLRALLVFIFLCLSGCVQQARTSQELPRAAPGYLHWLQKESMLAQAPGLIAQVSQSPRMWMQASEPGRANVLLEAAPNWLEIVEAPASTSSPYFRSLVSQIASAKKMGFNGIFLGPTGEHSDIWAEKKPFRALPAASLNFDASFGTEADFKKLAQTAEANGLELGSSLIASATGIGPDFFLQARNSPTHAGLYAMLPVPTDAEKLLPSVSAEWDCRELNQDAINQLANAGILPESVARDKLAWASRAGWAVTGPVMGVDGVVRRWLYRFSENPGQPVLSWSDPSGNAARLLDAAAIQHTGLQGQSLAGVHFESLMALEPGTGAQPPTLSPGMTALAAVARQIHRYGGWALQADPLPLPAILETLSGPCDFCRDDITELLALYGLLAADPEPLANLYRALIKSGTDICRLARGYNAHKGLRPRLLLAAPEWARQGEALATLGEKVTSQKILSRITPRGETEPDIKKIRRFLLSWRLGLPGLAFVDSSPGSQSPQSDDWLEHTLASRTKNSLSTGKAVKVIQGKKGALGILTQLQSGNFWLLASNFGSSPDELPVPLPKPVKSAFDAGTGKALNASDALLFHISLDGRDSRNVLFEIAE